MENRYLPHAEASSYLGISASTLYKLVSTRKIAVIKIGSKSVFSRDDLDSFMSACRVPAISGKGNK